MSTWRTSSLDLHKKVDSLMQNVQVVESQTKPSSRPSSNVWDDRIATCIVGFTKKLEGLDETATPVESSAKGNHRLKFKR